MNRILYVQYTNPAGYPPLQHSSQILAEAGWQVLFLGVEAEGTEKLHFPPHLNITVQKIRYSQEGWRQKLHYVRFATWVLKWALQWRPQWIYASDALSCPVALVLSYLPGVCVIYHEHDSPSVTTQSVSRFQCFVLWTRKHLSQRAELSILPNEQRVKLFSKEVANGKPVVTVWNCPRLEEVPEARGTMPNATVWVYYHGNIGPSYLPLALLEALAMLPPKLHLRIIGYETVGTQGYAACWREKAERLGIEDRVEVIGPMPRYKLLESCNECDIGLAFVPKNDQDLNNVYKLGASNRPFDYLACGLALLVSDLPDWQAMYVDPGYGLACDPEDPQSIADALRWFLDHPEEMRAMGERGRKRILEEWNYERQFEPVLQHLVQETP